MYILTGGILGRKGPALTSRRSTAEVRPLCSGGITRRHGGVPAALVASINLQPLTSMISLMASAKRGGTGGSLNHLS